MNDAKLLDILLAPTEYEPDAKAQFHRTARKLLKSLAVRLTSNYGEYDLRSNMGGIAVSGEVTLHMERVYVQVSQSVMGPKSSIMFRECKGRKDYTGGQNNFAVIGMLLETEKLARLIETRCSFVMLRGERIVDAQRIV